ncbi:MAG: hypothetical protein NTY22_02490, partial [Proteobacteria bacterium]|nr:hypothetical protein [Pseudomonadota bacterium]
TGVDPTATFATDTPYNNQAITDQDFFIIRVTAQDATTILYYKIVVTVLPTYSLAAAGPSGGWIFYINANYATDGWRYLEAGALSTQTTAYWSNTSHSIGTSSDIGTGQANTTAIVTYLNSIPETGMAAQVCNDLSVTNGAFTYNDWFLPALSEVGQMYANIKVVGGFTTDPNTFYWSSTENGPSNVLLVNFNNGTQPTASKSFGPLRFRCARAF